MTEKQFPSNSDIDNNTSEELNNEISSKKEKTKAIKNWIEPVLKILLSLFLRILFMLLLSIVGDQINISCLLSDPFVCKIIEFIIDLLVGYIINLLFDCQ